jgi:hypothetical protein
MYQYPNPIYKDVLAYYDKRPMVLIIGTYKAKTTGRQIVQGINLNFIPEKEKVQLLDTYYRVFGKHLIDAEIDSARGLISQAKNIAKYLIDWSLLTSTFVKQGKIPLSFAIRNYAITGILNPVFIEIEEWSLIPFFGPRDFHGTSPAQVYADYRVAKKGINAIREISSRQHEEIKKQHCKEIL